MYFASEPQYPFGHGLSYTTFSLARLTTSAASVRLAGQSAVSVDAANTGARDGDEVVQLCARFPGSRSRLEDRAGTLPTSPTR
jgi:beta-glucosidase